MVVVCCVLPLNFANLRLEVGAVLQTSSFSAAQLLVARFVTGIGTGIETSTVPMYQSELCRADKRGRLVASEALFVGVGSNVTRSNNWCLTTNIIKSL